MSELERLEDETPNEPVMVAASPEGAAAEGTATTPPKKKRRRGSRGGRGRKRPNKLVANTTEESLEGSEDWSSEEADRGLTDDDIAEQAREDAGIAPTRTPRVGDSRPAPKAAAAADAEAAPKKRRRRRGGRGRGKGGGGASASSNGGGGGGGGGSQPRAKVQYVDAGELGNVDV